MFSTLRRLFVLVVSAVASGLLFAPVAFAVQASDGAAGAANVSTTPRHTSGRSSLATWEWTLITMGIVVAVALIVAAGLTLYRRSGPTPTLQPQTP